jgi:hypothetical protein
MPKGCLGIVVIGVVVFLLIAMFGERKPDTPEQRRADNCADTDSAKIGAFVYAQEFVNRTLKAPATAKYPSFSDDSVRVIYKGNCQFSVIGYVDAQNSFGALIRSRFAVDLSYDAERKMWTRNSANVF